MSSAGWGPVSAQLSHTGEESEWRLVVGGQRRLREVEGGPLNQGDVRGNGKVQVAGAKGRPGEGKALVAERHSGMSRNEGKLRSWPGLVTR